MYYIVGNSSEVIDLAKILKIDKFKAHHLNLTHDVHTMTLALRLPNLNFGLIQSITVYHHTHTCIYAP